MVYKKRTRAKKTKKTIRRKTTKWYYMADTSGAVKLVGLVPARKLTPLAKTRKKIISGKLKRK